jgi:hypothetical protein
MTIRQRQFRNHRCHGHPHAYNPFTAPFHVGLNGYNQGEIVAVGIPGRRIAQERIIGVPDGPPRCHRSPLVRRCRSQVR